jgi:hypothetical protein
MMSGRQTRRFRQLGLCGFCLLVVPVAVATEAENLRRATETIDAARPLSGAALSAQTGQPALKYQFDPRFPLPAGELSAPPQGMPGAVPGAAAGPGGTAAPAGGMPGLVISPDLLRHYRSQER